MLPWCLPPSVRSIRHRSGADNNWRLLRWPPEWPPWIRFWWRYLKCEKLRTDIPIRGGPLLVKRPWHKLIWSIAQDKLTIEDLQDGCCGSHHGYPNKMVLAILNSSFNSPCFPNVSHQVSALNPIYCSEADVFSRFSCWPPWWPSWILEWNKFNNSKSPCHPNASYQVWAQSN